MGIVLSNNFASTDNSYVLQTHLQGISISANPHELKILQLPNISIIIPFSPDHFQNLCEAKWIGPDP